MIVKPEFFLNYCLDTNIMVGMLRPFPGSKVFDYCMKKGLIDKPGYYERGCMDDINMTSALEGMPPDMECECILIEYLVKKNKLREASGRLNRLIEVFPQ